MSSSAARTGNAARVALLVLLLTALGAACQPPGRAFQTTLDPHGERPLPVTMTDETGLIVEIEPATIDSAKFSGPFNGTLEEDPANPRAAILLFYGGMCDQDAKLAFRLHEGVYELRVDVEQKGFGNCPAAAILRSVRIVTSEPIPVATVLVVGD